MYYEVGMAVSAPAWAWKLRTFEASRRCQVPSCTPPCASAALHAPCYSRPPPPPLASPTATTPAPAPHNANHCVSCALPWCIACAWTRTFASGHPTAISQNKTAAAPNKGTRSRELTVRSNANVARSNANAVRRHTHALIEALVDSATCMVYSCMVCMGEMDQKLTFGLSLESQLKFF